MELQSPGVLNGLQGWVLVSHGPCLYAFTTRPVLMQTGSHGVRAVIRQTQSHDTVLAGTLEGSLPSEASEGTISSHVGCVMVTVEFGVTEEVRVYQ